jgi:hypothetical protein
MIKVQNNTATRAPIPAFLQGLAPESLADLSWTDPALGVSDAAWWPEEDASPALAQYERYGDETLTVGDGVVQVTRAVVPWTQAEIDAAKAKQAEAVKSEIIDATQKRLDDFAGTRDYNSILSACTYATSTVPVFKSDGQYCVNARDATWGKLYDMMAEVEAGTRPMPSGFADIEGELPVLAWPKV